MVLQIIGLAFGALIIVFVARSFYVSQPLFKEKIRQAPDRRFSDETASPEIEKRSALTLWWALFY